MFESRKLKKHWGATLETCERIVVEDDRVYRNQVLFFAEHYHPAEVSGLGLSKARLFGALFPAYVFFVRWQDRDDDVQRMLQVCSGTAAIGVTSPGSQPYIPHEHLRSLAQPFLRRLFQCLADERHNGPSITPAGEDLTVGFRGLLEMCHEALIDSVGEHHYNMDLRPRTAGGLTAREHFEILFKGGLIERFRVIAHLSEALR